MKRIKNSEPMDSTDKATVWGLFFGLCAVLGISAAVVNSNQTNTEARQERLAARFDLCNSSPDPAGCLVIVERIDACNNLSDGEDNCLSALQMAIEG